MDQLPASIESRIQPEPNSGCWFWVGACNARGYGAIKSNGRTRGAHRVVYEALVGDVPDGLVLDHLCRVHCCVNPDHLEAVTQAENVRRGALWVHGMTSRTLGREEFRKYERLYRQTPQWRANKRRELDKRIADRAHIRASKSRGKAA